MGQKKGCCWCALEYSWVAKSTDAVNSPLTHYSTDQQREAYLGALVEYSLFPIYHKVFVALCAEQIRTIGCENVILSTDFGQTTTLSDEY